MLNKALAHAIVDCGKKKQTIARLARMEPWELSRVLHGTKALSDVQKERLASVLGKPIEEVFPPAAVML